MQAKYAVRAKQLAACLTGRKYLGGTDRKASRKHKASGEEASPPVGEHSWATHYTNQDKNIVFKNTKIFLYYSTSNIHLQQTEVGQVSGG